MSTSTNKELVSIFYASISHANLNRLDNLLTTDVVWHDPLLPGGEVRGVENFKNVLKMFRSALPDLQIHIDDMIEGEEKVITRFTIHATHAGELLGAAATGKKIKVTGISIIRCDNGRIAEEWIEEDTLGLLRQIGAIPS